MTREILNRTITGVVETPQSKSLLQRYLIAGGLSRDLVHFPSTNRSKDIQTMKECLGELGLGQMSRGPVIGTAETPKLNCRENGTAYRFLLPLACALGRECEFLLEDSLISRPMDQLYAALRTHGVRREDLAPDHIRISGQMTAGTFVFPGETNGQMISGLLMALPLLRENSTVMVELPPESESYVEMTLAVMRESGIQIRELRNQGGVSRVYKVAGRQRYSVKHTIPGEGDWSLAAFWLAGAAIGGGPVTCTNLNLNSLQGDKVILDILRKFCAEVETSFPKVVGGEDGTEIEERVSVTVRGGKLKGAEIDASDIPDLIAPIALMGCAAEGITLIRNAKSLRAMENDRLLNILETLNDLGGQVAETNDGFLIIGNNYNGLAGGRVTSFGDHRCAMMAAVASAICKENVVLERSEAVEKSYPDFFRDLGRLQGA